MPLVTNLQPAPAQPGTQAAAMTVLSGPYVLLVHRTQRQLEEARVVAILPTPIGQELLVPGSSYAKWNGGNIKIDDRLLAQQICPSDLLGVACEWDEFHGGCKMVRLCKQLEKYTTHVCPDAGQRHKNNQNQPINCGHVHFEVEHSCRFVANQHLKPDRKCKMVLEKNYNCAAGHDLETARQAARDAHWRHLDDAKGAGSMGKVNFTWQY